MTLNIRIYSIPTIGFKRSHPAVCTPPTQYRVYGRRFYRSKDPTNSIKVLKEHKEYTNNTKIQ